ncbi:uncharacterized protein LOC143610937 [Bidens hawaiensis]|uniref:uncharacterized protein LOC143610937 n=1 Tax=Bidens hawaiensis TaxID=980011 RepID=UPI00404A53B5
MTDEYDTVSPHQSEEQQQSSKEIEDDDDVSHLPPLLDMIDFPPALTLPPTPPLPCSPADLEMEEQDSDEDDGPPPGWDNRYQLKEQQAEQLVTLADTSAVSSDIHMQTKDARKDAHNEEGEPLSQAHSCLPSEVAPSVDEQDSEDDGPPPGWNSKCQPERNLQVACLTPPTSDIKNEEDKQHALDNEGFPPGWGSTPQQQPHVHSTLPSPIVQSESFQPPSRQQSIYPTKPQISSPKPPMTMNNPEMGQMVCGSCRHLLSYPKGARYVECACCLEENYVLEEHEVGQVVCGGCNVLLMYPYGAPKVRCANCRAETEIGDQNRRPSLFEHKRWARQHLRRVHAG